MWALKRYSPRAIHFSVLLAGVLLVLSGCSSSPIAIGNANRDGPPIEAGPDPLSLPDPVPRVEPIREGGPNKPYEVLGQTYVPVTRDAPLSEQGLASWYGRKFQGRRTASGELFNMHALTAAHRTMPIPSYARVRNPVNGREVIVRINDRGPFSNGRVIDLSWAAAVKLGVQGGVSPVEIERLTNEDIRAAQATAALKLFAAPAPPAAASPLDTVAATVPPAAESVAPAPAPPATALASLLLPERLPVEPQPARAFTAVGVGFWLQLGAFSKSDRAMAYRLKVAEDVEWLAPMLAVFTEGGVSRLQAGPYASREEAASTAEQVRVALKVSPLIVERR
jgi:rare lipoprotein A